jgi:ABC-type phosphate transport system substrate-binding protein
MPPTARALLASLALAAASPALAEEFKVVVHPDNPAGALDRTQLSRLFLKKVLRWPDGTAALPVEPTQPRLRSEFAQRVHGRSANAIKAYWNQLIFSGRDVPPLERPGDAEVVAYVRLNRGAVGYVSAGAPTEGVKTVEVQR